MTQKKVAQDLTFRPTDTFPTCVGFFVRASIEAFGPGDKLAVVSAFEPDGYEVRFIAPVKGLAVGQEIDVPGHAITGYSGALGAWGPARIRTS